MTLSGVAWKAMDNYNPTGPSLLKQEGIQLVGARFLFKVAGNIHSNRCFPSFSSSLSSKEEGMDANGRFI